jgi:hypothetical protein
VRWITDQQQYLIKDTAEGGRALHVFVKRSSVWLVLCGCVNISKVFVQEVREKHFFLYGSTVLYGPGPPRFVEVSWSHTLETHHSR